MSTEASLHVGFGTLRQVPHETLWTALGVSAGEVDSFTDPQGEAIKRLYLDEKMSPSRLTVHLGEDFTENVEYWGIFLADTYHSLFSNEELVESLPVAPSNSLALQQLGIVYDILGLLPEVPEYKWWLCRDVF